MDNMEQKLNGFQNKNSIKIGKRINKEDLLRYIENNKEVMKNINYVDLNESSSEKEMKTIEQSNFQTTSEVKYLPPNLSIIMNLSHKKYLHVGCLKTMSFKNGKISKTLKISFLTSIITCFDHSFSSMTVANQTAFIQNLFGKLKSEIIGDQFKQYDYAKMYGWTKDELYQDIIECIYSPKIIKTIEDFFHINIFILDLEKDQLLFHGDKYVKHKRSIFILKYNESDYEPLFLGSHRYFTTENNQVNNINNIINNFNQITIVNLDKNSNAELKITEFDEDLTKYKPKPKKEKQKIEKPEIIAEKLKQTKNQMSNEISGEDTINAYSDNDEPTNQISHLNKIKKSLSESDSSDSTCSESEDEKPIKKSKMSTTKKPHNTKKSDAKQSEIKLSDIKPSLKLDELKTIAMKLGIQTNKKTKAVLIEEIKSNIKDKINSD